MSREDNYNLSSVTVITSLIANFIHDPPKALRAQKILENKGHQDYCGFGNIEH